jgi:hypothetical protein
MPRSGRRSLIWLCPYCCTHYRLFHSILNLILIIVLCLKLERSLTSVYVDILQICYNIFHYFKLLVVKIRLSVIFIWCFCKLTTDAVYSYLSPRAIGGRWTVTCMEKWALPRE